MTPARKRQNLNEWYGSLIASTKIWPAARSSQLDRVPASVLRAAHVLLQYDMEASATTGGKVYRYDSLCITSFVL